MINQELLFLNTQKEKRKKKLGKERKRGKGSTASDQNLSNKCYYELNTNVTESSQSPSFQKASDRRTEPVLIIIVCC